MFSFFLTSVICEILTGEQRSSVYKSKIYGDFTVEDCYFKSVGGYMSKAPLYVGSDSTDYNVKLLRSYFVDSRSDPSGSFYFWSKMRLQIEMVGVEKCYWGQGKTSAAGRVDLKQPFTLNMSSFSGDYGGTKNLNLAAACTVTSINMSGCQSDGGWLTYSYGNLCIGNAPDPVTLKYSNIESCESNCGVLYFDKTQASNTVSFCNFIKNTMTSQCLIYVESAVSSETTTLSNCVVNGNILSEGVSAFWGKTKLIIVECTVDSSSFYESVEVKSWTVKNATAIPMTLYETVNIKAVIGQNATFTPVITPKPADPYSPNSPGEQKPAGDGTNTTNSTSEAKEGFASKKLGPLPMWAVIVIGVVVVVAVVAGYVVYRIMTKPQKHHHHIHKHKHRSQHHNYDQPLEAQNSEQPDEVPNVAD